MPVPVPVPGDPGVEYCGEPNAFGPWETVFNRFDRWSKRSDGQAAEKWTCLFEADEYRDDPHH